MPAQVDSSFQMEAEHDHEAEHEHVKEDKKWTKKKVMSLDKKPLLPASLRSSVGSSRSLRPRLRRRRSHSPTKSAPWNMSISANEATSGGRSRFGGFLFFRKPVSNTSYRRGAYQDYSFSYDEEEDETEEENPEGTGRGQGTHADYEQDEREDPVMALFRARATHRVRFSLEQQQQPTTPPYAPTSSSSFETTTSPPSSPTSSSLKRSSGLGSSSTTATSEERLPAADSSDNKTPSPPLPFSSTPGSSSASASASSVSLHKFVKNALFGRRRSPDFDAEVAKIDGMVWDARTTPKNTNRPWPFVSSKKSSPSSSSTVFVESKEIRKQVNKLLNKAFRAQHVHFRYEYSVKCCMRALEILQMARYPEDHAIVAKTLQTLNAAHHAQSSLENSANIVKMGIKYEDAGDYIRALKMYTIAYRIRRDNLGCHHPSLTVLLNMLGSIQVKRDELEEAMDIFELALNEEDDEEDDDDGEGSHDDDEEEDNNRDDNNPEDELLDLSDGEDNWKERRQQRQQAQLRRQQQQQQQRPSCYGGGRTSTPAPSRSTSSSNNLLAKSVAYREMGIIYERWGDVEEALRMYHKSLDCIAEYKGIPSMHQLQQQRRRQATSSAAALAPLLPQDEEEEAETQQDCSVLNNTTLSTSDGCCASSPPSEADILMDLESVKFSRPFAEHTTVCTSNNMKDDEDEGGMELFIGSTRGGRSSSGSGTGSTGGSSRSSSSCSSTQKNKPHDSNARSSHSFSLSSPIVASTCYDIFFLEGSTNMKNHHHRNNNKFSIRSKTTMNKKKGPTLSSSASSSSYSSSYSSANVDVALTLHQIGQLHRAQGEYNLALAAFSVALRGMKESLGRHHPNVASILGNIGNLQKEMGDLNASFETYQQVLAIESYRLGLSHPDVAITLHNVATIDAARGNHESALALYDQVRTLQKKLYGDEHLCLAVTSACMGDVYERIGKVDEALECFEEALRIKTATLGRHSIEVARILHKLGKLSFQTGDVPLADSYLSRTVLIYRLNRLRDDNAWMVEAHRDVADIEAAIVMTGRTGEEGIGVEQFEC